VPDSLLLTGAAPLLFWMTSIEIALYSIAAFLLPRDRAVRFIVHRILGNVLFLVYATLWATVLFTCYVLYVLGSYRGFMYWVALVILFVSALGGTLALYQSMEIRSGWLLFDDWQKSLRKRPGPPTLPG